MSRHPSIEPERQKSLESWLAQEFSGFGQDYESSSVLRVEPGPEGTERWVVRVNSIYRVVIRQSVLYEFSFNPSTHPPWREVCNEQHDHWTENHPGLESISHL
jgi:hypothetical protein